jgi:hypothetical protein
LSKQQEADFIVAAVKAGKKLDQAEPVSHKGGRGKINELKAEAVAIGEVRNISEATIKRSLANDGKPRPDSKSKPAPKPKRVTIDRGIEAARRHYAAEFGKIPASEHDVETTLLVEALRKTAANE